MSFHSGVTAALRRRAPAAGGGGLIPVSAASWRVALPCTDGYSEFIIAEVGMRATKGGTTQTTGGTASASSGTNVANAFDGSAGTSWLAGSGKKVAGWLRYDFSAPVQVVEVAITTSTVGTAGPRHVLLQYSSDGGATWTTWAHWCSLSWAASETKVLNDANHTVLAEGQAVAWRMNCSANNGNSTWTEINEIDMRGQAGGADLAVAGGASAWSSDSNSPANAFDEGASTTPLRWASPAVPGWISYVFRDPVSLAEMVVEAKGGSSAPRDFTIERSNDHQVWTVARTVVSSTGWTSNERRVFSIQ